MRHLHGGSEWLQRERKEKEVMFKAEKEHLWATKQAGRVWNQHLHKGLTKLGYVLSKIDSSMYYKEKFVFMLYVDDEIFVGPVKSEKIKTLITGLKRDFNIIDGGNLREYLRVLVEKLPDGRYKLSQQHLIKLILSDLWFGGGNKIQSNTCTRWLSVRARHRCQTNGRGLSLPINH
jgi:hypothetical protein